MVYRWLANASLDAYLSAVIFERIVYRTLPVKEFLINNGWKLPIIIFFVVLWGNIRVKLAQKVSCIWRGNVRKTILAFVFIAVVLLSILCGVIVLSGNTYSFFAKNADTSGQLNTNQASIVENYVLSDDCAIGNITYGLYINLEAGEWKITVEYEVNQDGFVIDAATETGATVFWTYKLETEKTK